MKKTIFLPGLALFLALAFCQFAPALHAQTHSRFASAQQQSQQTSQVFTGQIMQLKSGQYALVTGKTDKGLSGHFLDDQKDAKKFVGKSVKVTGTLDASSNTIHVTNIQGA